MKIKLLAIIAVSSIWLVACQKAPSFRTIDYVTYEVTVDTGSWSGVQWRGRYETLTGNLDSVKTVEGASCSHKWTHTFAIQDQQTTNLYLSCYTYPGQALCGVTIKFYLNNDVIKTYTGTSQAAGATTIFKHGW